MSIIRSYRFDSMESLYSRITKMSISEWLYEQLWLYDDYDASWDTELVAEVTKPFNG